MVSSTHEGVLTRPARTCAECRRLGPVQPSPSRPAIRCQLVLCGEARTPARGHGQHCAQGVTFTPGPPRVLEPYQAWIRAAVAEQPDITLAELCDQLDDAHGV